MKFATVTLGCKVNQYETQAMETLLKKAGHEPADVPRADVILINTCAVTGESGRKSRQAVRRARAENSKAAIVICGCYSQVSPKDAGKLGADLIYGSGDRAGLVRDIGRLGQDRAKKTKIDNPKERRHIERLPSGSVSGRTRAMLKVEDGCGNYCTYCIIPYARGPVRSLPVKDAVREAERLADEGFGEIVITGIEIASYGKDLSDGSSLAELVAAVSRAVPGLRIRLGSLEPRIITKDFCRTLREAENICPHFHLSLQSGSDKVLKRMGRRYSTADFFQSVQLLRHCFPDCGITADLIVGFPGETEEDFQDTLSFIERCGFSSMHIFPYSARPGTAAAGMEGQLDNKIKSRRAGRAARLAQQMKENFLQTCVGKTLPVLFETEGEDISTGRGDNNAEVRVKARGLKGLVKNVKITGILDGMLVGEVI